MIAAYRPFVLVSLKSIGENDIIRHDFLHRIVAEIGDENTAPAVHGNALGTAKPAAQREDRGLAARRQDFLHRKVEGIGDEDIAAAVHGNAFGTVKPAAQRFDRGIAARR